MSRLKSARASASLAPKDSKPGFSTYPKPASWLILPGRDRANALVRWIAGTKIGAEFAEPISLEGLEV